MSTPRHHHPDRLVDAFLEEGPVRMSDRLFDAVVDDIYRTRQWGVSAPWRDFFMQRSRLAAAVIVVALAVAGTALVLLRPSEGRVGTPPSPVPSTSVPASAVPAVGPSLAPAGSLLLADTFSEPFTFTMPAFPDAGSTPVAGAMTNGGYAISSTYWGVVSFHDDVPLPADMCRPSGPSIDDVPGTTADVGLWLESATGLMVSPPISITVDGRSATSWDVQTGGHCDARGSRPPFFGPNERHRVYAVPTGTDTVLVFTWGVDWGNGSEEHLDEINTATDELVRSMRFGANPAS